MCQARARRPERERACARELDRASRWHSTAMLLFPSIVLGALCVAASVSVQECGSGNGACAAPEAAVRIVSPAEGEALTARLPAGAAALGRVAAHGIVEIEARGAFAKVALYLDGQFVSATLLGAAVGRVELEFPLPSGAEACGRWHFVEVALMDAEDWRLENPEAAASVRFTLGCAGQDSSAAARHAAAAREEREKRERAQVFAGIYESFGWEPSADGSKETRSGPGSYVARTNASRAFLSDVLRRFNVGSVLDAGCGDVNWQGLTPGIDEVDYFGIDIVPQMIADNVRRLGGPGRRMRFAVKDVVKDDLGGPYDLVLCRDTLFHLPLWDAVQALRNLQATDARYFLSHYDEDLNTNWPDIPAGGWHMINLLAPPFKLPPPLLSVPEAGNEGDAGAMAHYGQSRKLGLWEFPVLPPVPSTRSASSSSPADTTSVAFSAPADTGPQEEGGDGTGPDAGAPREGGGDAGAEHEVYGWVGQKQQHTLKRCVLVAPGSVESVESVGGQSARHHLPPGGQWWPVDVIFSIAGGVAGSEGGRGVVNEVPAHGVNGRVDEALLSAASSLGVEIVGSGGNMAGAKASGGGKIVSAGARGLLAAVWLGCGPVLLVGGWGAGAEGELLQVRGLGGSAGKDPEAAEILDAIARSGRLVLAVVPGNSRNVTRPNRAGATEAAGVFHAKLLQDLHGESVLQRTFSRAVQARVCAEVVIATESDEVVRHATSFGARVLKTSPHWKSGTERVFETWRLLAQESSSFSSFPPNTLTKAPKMGTLSTPLSREDAANAGIVKVVADQFHRALYFSRSPIPGNKPPPTPPPPGPSPYQRHLGLYGFQAEFLETFISLPNNEFVLNEDLEQLKVIGAGLRIAIAQVANATAPDVNTQQDLDLLRKIIAAAPK